MNKRILVSFLLSLIVASGGIAVFDHKDFIANADMMIVPDSVCGDGRMGFKVGIAEECDDGNLNNNDGCSSLCKVEDTEMEVPLCSDNIDNDGDGVVDGKDAGCHTDWNADNPSSYDPSWAGEYEIERVSLSSDGTEGNSDSYTSSVSADGRFVAFNSNANNLVPGDNNKKGDVFIRDRLLGETKRASVSSMGIEGNSDSFSPSVSIDGRFVAFASYAKNLVPGDNNNKSDIFVHDFLTGETRMVNLAFDGAEANDSCHSASISPDGRYVRFYSYANNLVAGHGGNWYDWDAFVYDYQTNKVESAPEVPDEAQDSTLYFSSFSADGRFTVFSSSVDDPIGDDTYQHRDVVFVYDSLEAKTTRVNLEFEGRQVEATSSAPSISADGRYIFFESQSEDSEGYSITDNLIYDRLMDKTARVNKGIGGNVQYFSYPGIISASGEFITFASSYWKLIPGDHNGSEDIFIVKNPLFGKTNSVPLLPTELKQRNESGGAEVSLGKIINEGAAESSDSVLLSAKVGSSDGGRVALEVRIESVDEVSGAWTSYEPIRSEYVASGEVATIDYSVPKGGLYTWRAKTVDEAGRESDWAHFGDNGTGADFISSNFSFVFLTDVHLGSNMAFFAKVDAFRKGEPTWYESLSYSRFTDVLYDIEKLSPRPDFILVGGDNIEYNNERWLYDFKSIIDNYSERTGIEIYVVPGNHDRYNSESSAFQLGETDLSGGNDYLHNFLSVMGNPQNVTSFFEGTGIMNLKTSGTQGLNQYNYYFDHKGFQFIGLDSGEDTGVWDMNPEGSGLNGNVKNEVERIMGGSSNAQSVIFMHHPIYAGEKDPSYYYKKSYDIWGNIVEVKVVIESEKTDSGEIAENGGIVHNWRDFISLCNENDVQLVLSGHEHNDPIFDKDGSLVNLSNWTESENEKYPLYIQTQSAGKKDNHGYRVIEVKNGKAIPHEAVTGVKKYEKVYTDLNAQSTLDFRAYDSAGDEITVGNNNKATMFLAENSNRRIIYNDTEKSHFEVKNNNSTDVLYDLHLQKREEWAEPAKQPDSVYGYHVYNKELCSGDASYCNGFIALIDGGDYKTVYFKNIKIKENSSHVAFVDWDDAKVDWGGILSTKIEGISFGVNGDYNNLYSRDSTSITVDLNSPGELRVFDKNDKVTGVVDGEIVENIPNSIYIPESETVYIFGDTRGEVADGLRTQVVGAYEATYDLSISLSENDEETSKFTSDDVLTDDRTTHQFSVNWEALERGEKGVTMQFDADKDTVFERSVPMDGSLSFPKAKLSAERYATNEGTEITFDGSLSSDSDGNITLYEWDFDEDGFYEVNSSASTMAHTYGDDFQGKVLLKVTDDEELTDKTSITSADVTVTNMNPTVSVSKLEIADTMDKFILEGDFTDSGWLDKHTASIDWGDGNVEQGVSLTEENISPDATGKIIATHKYSQLQNYVVKLTVEDDNGGIATSEIILESPKQIKQVALLRLKAIQTDNKNVRKEIDKAIGSLKESLVGKYWKDDFHLNLLSSPKFFSEEQKTIKSLEKILEDKKKNESFQDTQEIQGIIDELSRSDVFLARAMVYEVGSFMAKDLKSAKSWIEKMLSL